MRLRPYQVLHHDYKGSPSIKVPQHLPLAGLLRLAHPSLLCPFNPNPAACNRLEAQTLDHMALLFAPWVVPRDKRAKEGCSEAPSARHLLPAPSHSEMPGSIKRCLESQACLNGGSRSPGRSQTAAQHAAHPPKGCAQDGYWR